MISKENFIKYINELFEIYKAEEELGRILSKLGSENTLFCDKYHSLVLNILEDVFSDKDNEWILYALYELDWFRDYRDGAITDENGRNVPLANAGDLYDLLIENMELSSN